MELGGVDLGNLVLVHLPALVQIQLVESLEHKRSSEVIHLPDDVSEELVEVDVSVSVGVKGGEQDSELVVGHLESVVVEHLEELVKSQGAGVVVVSDLEDPSEAEEASCSSFS